MTRAWLVISLCSLTARAGSGWEAPDFCKAATTCEARHTTYETGANTRVHVIDTAGKPVPGVTLQLAAGCVRWNVTSDENGVASQQGYLGQVRASHEGRTGTAMVDGTPDVNLVLLAPSTIQLTVKGAKGELNVELTRVGTGEKFHYSARGPRVVLDQLTEGSFVLRAKSASGSMVACDTVTVREGTTSELTLSLHHPASIVGTLRADASNLMSATVQVGPISAEVKSGGKVRITGLNACETELSAELPYSGTRIRKPVKLEPGKVLRVDLP